MEDIINWVILIASFLTAITTICMFCKKAINKGFEPIYGRIDKIDENQLCHLIDCDLHCKKSISCLQFINKISSS